MIPVLPFTTLAQQVAAIDRVVTHLRDGGLIACPTETVYGFGCALQPAALDRLAMLKERLEEKPFLIVVREARDVHGIEWSREALALAARFWPGPLTLALRVRPDTFPARVVSADGTVAVRATSHHGLRRVLEELGEPITSTSANAPGGRPARSSAEVLAVLAETADPSGVLVLDGGTLPASAPSTIVDATVRPPRVLREGAIDVAELAEIVHGIRTPEP
jgi:L-threonylcarbamoyladenylate synthase